MERQENNTPQLDAPGKGLPSQEAFVGKYIIFPTLKTVISWNLALKLFESEGNKILALTKKVSIEDQFRQVLVPRKMGMEDSSRFWSLAMTLQHLIIVGDLVSDFMIELSHGKEIKVVLDTATVKPDKEVSSHIVKEYEDFLVNFRNHLEKNVDNKYSSSCNVHPWFGCLNPHQWLVLLFFHQFIHRRQIVQIINRL